ncbi:hypothetical protein V8G54_034294 [Vigna mungo]|uniref:Uncharacterized protein n=1 Tax=Vigna mungo TaxID=3915 RepID=A0AAQ3MPY8_VIGMU
MEDEYGFHGSVRQRVIGEPVASGLVLEKSWLWHPDFDTAAKYVMSPPIRKRGHDKALQAALSTGILQLVGTDHCAFNSTQKALGIDDFWKIPNGVNGNQTMDDPRYFWPKTSQLILRYFLTAVLCKLIFFVGIEERMHVVWDTMVESGQISVMDYVRLTSTEWYIFYIIILNPNSSFEITAKSHHSRLDTNVFEGRRGKGKIEVTIAGGRVVWENNELKVAPGTGRYIKMSPFSYLFDGIDKRDDAYLKSLQYPVKRAKSSS